MMERYNNILYEPLVGCCWAVGIRKQSFFSIFGHLKAQCVARSLWQDCAVTTRINNAGYYCVVDSYIHKIVIWYSTKQMSKISHWILRTWPKPSDKMRAFECSNCFLYCATHKINTSVHCSKWITILLRSSGKLTRSFLGTSKEIREDFWKFVIFILNRW